MTDQSGSYDELEASGFLWYRVELTDAQRDQYGYGVVTAYGWAKAVAIALREFWLDVGFRRDVAQVRVKGVERTALEIEEDQLTYMGIGDLNEGEDPVGRQTGRGTVEIAAAESPSHFRVAFESGFGELDRYAVDTERGGSMAVVRALKYHLLGSHGVYGDFPLRVSVDVAQGTPTPEEIPNLNGPVL